MRSVTPTLAVNVRGNDVYALLADSDRRTTHPRDPSLQSLSPYCRTYASLAWSEVRVEKAGT